MNVLSLFDGMSCGQIALERVGIKVDKYYASEIKAHAIKVTQFNYPNTIQLGDVNNYKNWNISVDLLIGGSPCQDFTRLKASNAKGVMGDKSILFFKYVECLHRFKPRYFLLENVIMDKTQENIITSILGVEPVRINSNLVSYQNRDRLYWTNIPGVAVPSDKNINFQDFKETDYEVCKEYKVKRTPSRENMWAKQCPNVTLREKINCLTCKQDRWSNAGLIEFEDFCRYLTVKECEQAQTVPVGYTNCLTRSQAYDVLGDGWTVDVIAHIVKGIKEQVVMTEKAS